MSIAIVHWFLIKFFWHKNPFNFFKTHDWEDREVYYTHSQEVIHIKCYKVRLFSFFITKRYVLYTSPSDIAGLSKGPGPPDPTRPERFWAGLRVFGSGFESKFWVIFGFGLALGLLYMLLLNPIFFCWRKPYTICWSLSASLSYSPKSQSHPVLSLRV